MTGIFELTEREIGFFRSAGYIRSRGLLDSDRVSRLRRLVDRQFEDKIAPYRVNQAGTICRLDRVIDRDPLFGDTLRLPAVLDPLLSLLGPNVELLRFRHNHATLICRAISLFAFTETFCTGHVVSSLRSFT